METDAALETGYGPRTPSGDNVHNDFTRGEASAWIALARARGDRVREERALGLALADGASPTPFGNIALLDRPLTDAEWDSATAAMHAFFAESPGGPYLVFSAWPTPDLAARGFGRVGHPPLMWRAPGDALPAPPAGLEIREVHTADDAAAWEHVLVHGYPMPELQPFTPGCLLPHAALEAPGWRHWVGLLDGTPVATSSAFTAPTQVHVEFVSALPEYRGRGVGAALTAVATAHDALPATLIASDLGRSVYEGMGYVTILRFTLWSGRRPG